jgi:hypothetical protein
MLPDGSKRRTWDQLTAAEATETDAEKRAIILEEMLAALEERERAQSIAPDSSGSEPSDLPASGA